MPDKHSNPNPVGKLSGKQKFIDLMASFGIECTEVTSLNKDHVNPKDAPRVEEVEVEIGVDWRSSNDRRTRIVSGISDHRATWIFTTEGAFKRLELWEK